MMRSGSVMRWQLVVWGLVGLACGSPAPDEEPAGAGARAGSSNGGNGAAASGNGSAGAGSRSGGGTGDGPVDPTETLPGVDQPLDTPPAGCVRGARNGVLQLELTLEIPSVELGAEAGKLLANGDACSDAAGNELLLINVTELQIAGGDEENAVVLDLGSGDWSWLFSTPESVQVALGEGENGLLVRGTAGDDHYRHAMRGSELVLDLVGDGSLQVVASGVTELGFSLGAGDDRLDNLAAEGLDALVLPLAVSGGAGNDWLVGGSGEDDFNGGSGDDVASGLDGADSFQSDVEGDGSDIWNGGPGYDELSYQLRTQSLDLSMCVSEASLGCADGECACELGSGDIGEGDRIVNIEDLRGGSGDDILHGSDVAESLRGGPGDDSLFGLGGSDLLAGERGIDQLEGGPDGDICDGQPGETATSCEL